MKLLILFCAVAVIAVQASPVDLLKEWKHFKAAFNKVYETISHEEERFKIFVQNKKMIDEHNRKFADGLVSFDMGVNQYADLTHDEFSRMMLGSYQNLTARVPLPIEMHEEIELDGGLMDSVDWRTKGAVTGVKNQAQCGSCWAFSATGAIEGQWQRKTGKLVSLSEQNLVDCSKSNHGCNGGSMELAFLYVKVNGGIDTETSYPYQGRDSSCRYNSANSGAKVTGYKNVGASESALQNAVASVGPVSIAIDAGKSSFQFYRSGVYVESACSSKNLNHGVLAIGYGSESGSDYWLVKNSWGTSWGIGGYIKMARNRNNQCGVATDASYPTV